MDKEYEKTVQWEDGNYVSINKFNLNHCGDKIKKNMLYPTVHIAKSLIFFMKLSYTYWYEMSRVIWNH